MKKWKKKVRVLYIIISTFSPTSFILFFVQGFNGPVGPEGMIGPMGKPVRSMCVKNTF